jgi:hypothetical protein
VDAFPEIDSPEISFNYNPPPNNNHEKKKIQPPRITKVIESDTGKKEET